MARAVIWSPAASADLDEIEAYVAATSAAGARRIIERIREVASRLPDFPFSARIIPELHDSYRRETFVYDYRPMYRVEHDRIRILRVVHGKRLLTNVPGTFEERAQEGYKAA